jgi:hypothetical protein
MVRENGPWLASKIKARLAMERHGWPLNPVIVCPDQEQGADVFAEMLVAVLNVQVVRIPRGVITECTRTRACGDFVRSHRSADWYHRLRHCSGEVIILDEFTVTRGTFLGLTRLLGCCLGKPPVCYFSICDFGDDTMPERWRPAPTNLVQTLYEWPKPSNYS